MIPLLWISETLSEEQVLPSGDTVLSRMSHELSGNPKSLLVTHREVSSDKAQALKLSIPSRLHYFKVVRYPQAENLENASAEAIVWQDYADRVSTAPPRWAAGLAAGPESKIYLVLMESKAGGGIDIVTVKIIAIDAGGESHAYLPTHADIGKASRVIDWAREKNNLDNPLAEKTWNTSQENRVDSVRVEQGDGKLTIFLEGKSDPVGSRISLPFNLSRRMWEEMKILGTRAY